MIGPKETKPDEYSTPGVPNPIPFILLAIALGLIIGKAMLMMKGST